MQLFVVEHKEDQSCLLYLKNVHWCFINIMGYIQILFIFEEASMVKIKQKKHTGIVMATETLIPQSDS